MQLYDYNDDFSSFKNTHDETGGLIKQFEFKYYDCFCGEQDYSVVSTTTRHRNHFDVVQCSTCGTLRINPYLTDRSINQYYRDVYGRIKRSNNSSEYLYERQARSSDELLRLLTPHLPANARVVDYGAGAGGRMAAFQAAGFDVYLQDLDDVHLRYGLAKGMKPFDETGTYDVIVLSHVVEHMNHPVEALARFQRLLAPGGKLYVEVPLMENATKLLREFHLAHKFYFTSESLTWLSQMAGFGKVADFPNAVLVSCEAPKDAPPASVALAKSSAELSKHRRKSRASNLKARIRSVLAH